MPIANLFASLNDGAKFVLIVGLVGAFSGLLFFLHGFILMFDALLQRTGLIYVLSYTMIAICVLLIIAITIGIVIAHHADQRRVRQEHVW